MRAVRLAAVLAYTLPLPRLPRRPVLQTASI